MDNGTWWVGWHCTIVTFCKAQLSAQFASLADFLTTFLLVNLFHLFYLYATFLGAIVGGIVNCVVNYKWVFRGQDVKMRFVALKYLFVWGGSILLNTWGTFALTEWITRMRWMRRLPDFYAENFFLVSKIVVAVLVAILWNYPLQQYFVFRNYHFKLWNKHSTKNKSEQ